MMSNYLDLIIRMCNCTKCQKHSVQAKKIPGTYCTKCDTQDKTLGICSIGTVSFYTRRKLNTRYALHCTKCFQNTRHKRTLGTKITPLHGSNGNGQLYRVSSLGKKTLGTVSTNTQNKKKPSVHNINIYKCSIVTLGRKKHSESTTPSVCTNNQYKKHSV
jgi:hypothetical protein